MKAMEEALRKAGLIEPESGSETGDASGSLSLEDLIEAVIDAESKFGFLSQQAREARDKYAAALQYPTKMGINKLYEGSVRRAQAKRVKKQVVGILRCDQLFAKFKDSEDNFFGASPEELQQLLSDHAVPARQAVQVAFAVAEAISDRDGQLSMTSIAYYELVLSYAKSDSGLAQDLDVLTSHTYVRGWNAQLDEDRQYEDERWWAD